MSAYSQAPAEVISLVFRKLPLREKLLCESVCRSWLQLLLDQRTPQLSPTTWGDQLRIARYGPLDVRKKITLQHPGSGFPRILLHPAQTEFTSTESAFIRWFTRMSSGFAIVDIYLPRMGGHAAENQTRSTCLQQCTLQGSLQLQDQSYTLTQVQKFIIAGSHKHPANTQTTIAMQS